MGNWWQIGVGAVAASVAALGVAALGGSSLKRLVILGLGVVFLLALVLAKDRKRLCILAFVALIPLNINYFLFGLYALPLHIGGAIGLYLIPADLPLAALYLLWLAGLADKRRARPMPSRARLALLFLPFLGWSALSMLYGASSGWAFYEWFRWLKVSLIIFYVSTQFSVADVWFSMHALGLALTGQGLIATAQMALRRNFGLDRLGVAGRGSEEVFLQGVGAAGEIVRGAGTLGHPNLLGSYLVLLLPIFMLLSLVDAHRVRRLAWAAVFAIGTAGLVATMSRTAWLTFVLASVAALVLAVGTRLVDARKVLALSLSAVILAAAAALPFYSVLMGRARSDFGESFRVRAELNQAAIQIALDHPVMGVGLNSYTLVYPDYAPKRAAQMKREEGVIAIVHNLYLLIWSEVGTVGFVAFFLFWGGALVFAARSLRHLTGVSAAVVIGIATGLCGLLAGDLLGFSLWLDSNMYTGALLVALLQPIAAGAFQADQGAAEPVVI